MAEDSFRVWRSWMAAFDRIDDERAGIIFKALMREVFLDEEPTFKDPMMMAFFDIMAGYAKQSRDIARERAERGKKGGRPKTDKTAAKTKRKPNAHQVFAVKAETRPALTIERVDGLSDSSYPSTLTTNPPAPDAGAGADAPPPLP